MRGPRAHGKQLLFPPLPVYLFAAPWQAVCVRDVCSDESGKYQAGLVPLVLWQKSANDPKPGLPAALNYICAFCAATAPAIVEFSLQTEEWKVTFCLAWWLALSPSQALALQPTVCAMAQPWIKKEGFRVCASSLPAEQPLYTWACEQEFPWHKMWCLYYFYWSFVLS